MRKTGIPLAREFRSRPDPQRRLLHSRSAVTHKPSPHVAIYHADDCSLCVRALEVVLGVQADLGFELEIVDIGGDSELEARYRELIPVVEIDGVQAFTYFVDAEALRSRLAGRE